MVVNPTLTSRANQIYQFLIKRSEFSGIINPSQLASDMDSRLGPMADPIRVVVGMANWFTSKGLVATNNKVLSYIEKHNEFAAVNASREPRRVPLANLDELED